MGEKEQAIDPRSHVHQPKREKPDQKTPYVGLLHVASGKGHVGDSKQLGVARRWERREWLLQKERSKVGGCQGMELVWMDGEL